MRRVRDLSQTIDGIESELADIARLAPPLLTKPGVRVLIAAELLGETARIDRFATDVELARTAPSRPAAAAAPATAWTAAALANSTSPYRLKITRSGSDPEFRAYRDRRTREGKTRREAVRCL